MNPEQYAAQQAQINLTVIASVQQFLSFYLSAPLTAAKWVAILQWLFPKVVEWRTLASELARRFWDSQFAAAYPDQEQHDVNLDHYEFEWFVEAMEPARKGFSRDGATQADLNDILKLVVHEVENAGRKTVIEAVQSLNEEILNGKRDLSEPAFTPKEGEVLGEAENAAQLLRDAIEASSKPLREKPSSLSSDQVVGWARIATGRETCSFCLALVSRGPVYKHADGAGLDLSDYQAVRSILANDPELEQLTRKFHPNCDCKVVPVFDFNNWSGKAASERALEIWKTVDRDVSKTFVPGSKIHKSGKKKGLAVTLNEEIMLEIRRRINAGLIDTSQIAAF